MAAQRSAMRWLVPLLGALAAASCVAAQTPAPTAPIKGVIAPAAAIRGASAGSAIRVVIAERAPAVEVRGASLEITELGACPSCRGEALMAAVARGAAIARSDAVRATPSGSGLEIA